MRPAILVAGGAGYIGSHVCKALRAGGYQPVVLDDLSRGHAAAVRWGPLEVQRIADVDRVRDVLNRYQVIAVVHLAAYAYVGESVAVPQRYFENNVIGSLRLLDAILSAGVRHIVFSSSCAIYGTPHRLPMAEDHPSEPLNPYGHTKLFIERVLQSYSTAHGLGWVSLRYFNAAGADPDGDIGEDHHPETHLIPLAIQAALGRGPIAIYGTDYPTADGTAIRDYVHVSDLAEAHVRALDYLIGGGPSRPFNLGTGQGHSVREVVAAVSELSGRAVPVIEAPRRPGDAPVLVANAAEARRELGWQPQHPDLETMIATAWRWQSGRSAGGARPMGGGTKEGVSGTRDGFAPAGCSGSQPENVEFLT